MFAGDLRTKLSGLKRDSLVDLLVRLLSETSDEEILQRTMDAVDNLLRMSSFERIPLGNQGAAQASVANSKGKIKKDRPFDMSKYRQHQIMMQIQYEGGPYFGFASQVGECEETIEKHLFESLMKLKLIENRQTSNYSRCGRTDRGVSALGQVISLKVRSGLKSDNSNAENFTEIDYCSSMNRCLPENIRVLAWHRVTPEFNARFSAASRTYRYFFVRRRLNIPHMQQAASLLVGSHDFRNFCKMDIANVSNFVREIYSAEIKPFMSQANGHGESDTEAESVWMLEITGVAFLWHMIRCIMAVLFMVGDHGEPPEVVSQLFDIDSFPGKPFYDMADELPLVLTECSFDKVHRIYEPKVLWSLTSHFEKLFDRHMVAAARAMNALRLVKNATVRTTDIHAFQASMRTIPRQNLDDSSALKRKRPEDAVEILGNDTSFILETRKWQDVLAELETAGIHPTEDKSSYTPLLQRNCGPIYEDRCESVGGTKKDRLKRHLSLKGNAAEVDPTFFARLRCQGTISN